MIRTTEELRKVCEQLRAEGMVAIDTEFLWRSTYRSRLALVQLGSHSGECWCVDSLLGLNVAPLAELLQDSKTVKVLHAAEQDLHNLFHYTGVTPKCVFDTQIAAGFVGLPANISLQKLLIELIGLELAKTETVTDWTQRPLTDKQIAYALDDVRYLGEARDILLDRADKAGTRAWLEEEMLTFENPLRYQDVPFDDAWLRVKCGLVHLEGVSWAILKRVAAVREKYAEQWNLPKAWLANDTALVEMAQSHGMVRFASRLRNNGQVTTLKTFFKRAIEEALAENEEDWPRNPHVHYLPEVSVAAGLALDFIQERANELGIDHALLANRAVVTAFVDNPDDMSNKLAQGWRYQVVGREIAERFQV